MTHPQYLGAAGCCKASGEQLWAQCLTQGHLKILGNRTNNLVVKGRSALSTVPHGRIALVLLSQITLSLQKRNNYQNYEFSESQFINNFSINMLIVSRVRYFIEEAFQLLSYQHVLIFNSGLN